MNQERHEKDYSIGIMEESLSFVAMIKEGKCRLFGHVGWCPWPK